MRKRASIVLAAGLVLTAVLVGVTLSHSPPVLAGDNSVPAGGEFADIHGGTRLCQTGETLPADTDAIRIGLNMALGARLTVQALAGSRVITRGSLSSGWRGVEVTVPIQRLAVSAAQATICANIGASNEPVGLVGAPSAPATAATSDGHALPGRVRIEYLRDGQRSWWAQASAVASRLGLGRPWSGGGIAVLVLALLGSVVSLATWLAVRSLP